MSRKRPPFELIDYHPADWRSHRCESCEDLPDLAPACGFYAACRAWEAKHGPLLPFDATVPTHLPDEPLDTADL